MLNYKVKQKLKNVLIYKNNIYIYFIVFADMMVKYILDNILNEAYGKIIYLLIYKDHKEPPRKIKGVLSKNTRMGEKQFRITWFSEDLSKNVHIDLDEEDVRNILHSRTFSDEIVDRLKKKYENADFETKKLLGTRYTIIFQ